jgi:hypothetical protein
MIMNRLSGGTFNEKPVEEKKSFSQSWQRSRYFVSDGSEWDAESDQDHQHYRSEVETKAMSEGQFNAFLDGLKKNLHPRYKARCKKRSLWRSICKKNVSKFSQIRR